VNNVQIFRQYGAVCFEQITREETPQAERLAAYLTQQFPAVLTQNQGWQNL